MKTFFYSIAVISLFLLLNACSDGSTSTGSESKISITFPDTLFTFDVRDYAGSAIPSSTPEYAKLYLGGTIISSEIVTPHSFKLHVENESGEIVDTIEFKTYYSSTEQSDTIKLSRFYLSLLPKHQSPGSFKAVVSVNVDDTTITHKFPVMLENAEPQLSVELKDTLYTMDSEQNSFNLVGSIESSDFTIMPYISCVFTDAQGDSARFGTSIKYEIMQIENNFNLSNTKIVNSYYASPGEYTAHVTVKQAASSLLFDVPFLVKE